jgi:type VI protein secretion system component VasF
MPDQRDDLTPEQRGKAPGHAERHARERLQASRLGRWGRPQSWATVAVAILIVIACYLLLRHA